MKNIAVVNLTLISDYFIKDILGESQINRVTNYAKTLTHVEEVIYLSKTKIEGIDNIIIKESWIEKDLIEELYRVSKDYNHIFYFFGDCPLLDSKLSNKMFQDHIKYYSEYTFADGFPYGLTPEILDTAILEPLNMLAKNSDDIVSRESIFNVVKKDINSFELETTIAPKDQRLLRISLTTDTKRNFNQLKRIVDNGGIDSESVPMVLENKPEILMVEPAYITVEITNKKVQETTYLPEREGREELIKLEDLETILDKVKKYSNDATFSFVPEYEPTTHPELLSIIKKITEKEFDLYIETSGVGWTQELVDEITSNEKVKLIVTMDALNPDLYRTVRGHGFEEATALVKLLVEKMKNRLWVQATRMKINEEDMEPFYRFWQGYTENIIIQKYSNYCGKLSDEKVADLSPLNRFPCWHLKRDLHITAKGEVLLCFNDINREYPLGSLLDESLEDIMVKKLGFYKDQIDCKYIDICRSCDEYYTFNF